MLAPQQADAKAAFEHYEAIRVSLSADRMTDVPKHATALAPLAEKVAGAEAKKSAEAIAGTKDMSAARREFAILSKALVPVFEKAGIQGVYFFVCPMENNASWAQKGKAIENPYYGKSMLTCGTPKKQ